MMATELMEELEWAIEQNGGDVEVRFAHQPKWAFEYSIRSATTVAMDAEDEERSDKVVYLEEGTQLGYLPENVSEELGWSQG